MNTNREEFKIKNNSLPIADVYRQSFYLSWRQLYQLKYRPFVKGLLTIEYAALAARVFHNYYRVIKTIIHNYYRAIKTIIHNYYRAIKTIIHNYYRAVKTMIHNYYRAIKTIIHNYYRAIKTIIHNYYRAIKTIIHNYYRSIKTIIAPIFLQKFYPYTSRVSRVSCIGSIFIGWNVYLNRVMRIIFQGERKMILHVILPCSYRHTPRIFWKEMVSKSYIRKKVGRVSGVVGDKCPYKNTSSPIWTLLYLSVYFLCFVLCVSDLSNIAGFFRVFFKMLEWKTCKFSMSGWLIM